MKIKIPLIASTALLCCAVILGSALAQQPQSEVNVKFNEGTEVVPPVDPDDPSKPLEPEEPGTGESGPLTFNYAAPISFGTQTVSSVTREYNALTPKPFIQVTDLRGTGLGWRVEASCSSFTNGVVPTLPGAVVHLDRGEAKSASATLAPPVPAGTISLPTNGTSQRIVSAGIDQGLGTWVVRWYPTLGPDNDSVRLTVLAGTATLDAHTAKITWDLIDAP